MTAEKRTALLRSTAAALRAQADALESAADAAEQDEADPWLDLASAAKQYPVAVDTLRSWAQRGRLRSCCAERGRIVFRKTWLERAIESRPYQPRRRADRAPDHGADVAEPDPLDMEIANGRLVATRRAPR